jgi:hypothetical protein
MRIPVLASQAATLTENAEPVTDAIFETNRPICLGSSENLNQSDAFSRKNESIGFVKSKIPKTDANESCQPASKRPVGFINSNTIAASAS